MFYHWICWLRDDERLDDAPFHVKRLLVILTFFPD